MAPPQVAHLIAMALVLALMLMALICAAAGMTLWWHPIWGRRLLTSCAVLLSGAWGVGIAWLLYSLFHTGEM